MFWYNDLRHVLYVLFLHPFISKPKITRNISQVNVFVNPVLLKVVFFSKSLGNALPFMYVDNSQQTSIDRVPDHWFNIHISIHNKTTFIC